MLVFRELRNGGVCALYTMHAQKLLKGNEKSMSWSLIHQELWFYGFP